MPNLYSVILNYSLGSKLCLKAHRAKLMDFFPCHEISINSIKISNYYVWFLQLQLLIKSTMVCLPCDALDKSELQGAECYTYQDLKKATNNFSEEYLVGKGGFGEVFKVIS